MKKKEDYGQITQLLIIIVCHLTSQQNTKEKPNSKSLTVTICYLNFPYFVIITLQMCVNYMIPHPFLWPAYFVNASHIPAANETLVSPVLVLHLVDSTGNTELWN